MGFFDAEVHHKITHPVIKFFQWLFALVVLILTALYLHDGFHRSYNNFVLFTAVITFVTTLGFVAHFLAFRLPWIAVLVVELLLWLFWLASFAVFADHHGTFCNGAKFHCSRANGIIALSVIEFILYFFTAVCFGWLARNPEVSTLPHGGSRGPTSNLVGTA